MDTGPVKLMPAPGRWFRRRLKYRQPARSGFALVVTLLLMVLLAIIALGLLSLSSVTLRTSTQGDSMAEARQNARLAMQMAIGQLQELTGSDTRITASSQIIDPNGPLQTGAWRSWEGSDHDPVTGQPIAPDYDSKMEVSTTFGEPDKRFLGWLTSASLGSAASVTPPFTGISKTPLPDHITMVGEGSVKDAGQQVHLKPTLIGDKGAFGWWTSGENAKAMLNKDGSPLPDTVAEWQERVKSNGVPDPNVFGLGAMDGLAEPVAIPSTNTFQLVDPAVDSRSFHDLTAYSRGLLTNTATGGWRKDMSLMTEAYGSLPDSGLPFFTLKPGEDLSFRKAPTATSGTAPAGSLLYGWCNYRGPLNGKPKWQAPAVASWDGLVDYTQQYKGLTSTGAARTTMPLVAPNGDVARERLMFQDRARRVPVVARLQFIYSLNSVIYEEETKTNYIQGQYQPGILITPVLTLWNPYNVELEVDNYAIDSYIVSPLAFWLNMHRASNWIVRLKPTSYHLLGTQPGSINGNPSMVQKLVSLQIPTAFTLPPGGSMVFGMKDIVPRLSVWNRELETMILSPGYSTKKGQVYLVSIGNTGSTFPGSNQYEMANITCNQQYGGSQIPGIACRDERYRYDNGSGSLPYGSIDGFGMCYTVLANTTPQGNGLLKLYNVNQNDYGANVVGTFRMVHHYPNLVSYTGLNDIGAIYPDFNVPMSHRIDSVAYDNSVPFAMTSLSTRVASPLAPANDHQWLYTKGMLQANPLAMNVETGDVFDDHKAVTTMAGSGVMHPANAPVGMDFYPVNGWNDTHLPQRDPATNSGYIVSGQDVSDGLTRCIIAEIPTRPLQSLAELQHFDARANNPVPPFQFNIIGNSSAQPLIAPDATFIPTPNSDGMCNDDSYCMNHLLFDDWFFSSIADDLDDFSATSGRTRKEVYEDHLTGAKPLPNRRYLPTPDAMSKSPDVAYDEDVLPPDTYQTIASKLEVDGMFNINSVSLDAWKAILRQTRNTKVPYIDENGETMLDTATDGYPYPRTTIAGDVACNGSTSTAGAPGGAEYAGYRRLTDAQVDALAGEIVSEIKRRGPFLSLSEFTNRQLVDDDSATSPALAGTIQQALDTLSNLYHSDRSSALNPFSALQSTSVEVQLPVGNEDYKFPEAAKGWSAFGVPGWIRQADILRPLAPMISARDDTFTIRAYGDSRSPSDPDKILARAWCEVTVKRTASYVDAANDPTFAPQPAMLTYANKLCGRRYQVVSFRWLNENEI